MYSHFLSAWRMRILVECDTVSSKTFGLSSHAQTVIVLQDNNSKRWAARASRSLFRSTFSTQKSVLVCGTV